MATVYLATQESLNRKVVLKIMSTQLGGSPEFAKRFLNEGHMLASVNHPNIITIYDIGIAEDFLFISMEYLDGGSLLERMQHGISPDEALDVVAQIGSALSVAHSKGIVHRDVKPANILYRHDGTPVLTDFGIAKQNGDNELTSTGTILGSPFYMSPEQIEGKLQLDGRSDIYSLGIILFEMLAGHRPFEGDAAINIVLKHLQSPIPRLAGKLASFQPLIDLMLAKNRDDRLPDAASLLDYISALRNPSSPESSRIFKRHDLRREPTGGTTRRYQAGAVTQTMTAVRHTHAKYWLIASGVFFTLVGILGWYFINQIHRYNTLIVSQSREPQQTQTVSTENVTPVTEISTGIQPATPAAKPRGVTQFRDEVQTALKWLGRKSLADRRLLAPEDDNAYYYFNRLLQIDPGNPQAIEGIYQIAETFATMAEEQIRANNYPQAEQYIRSGLEIDPTNKRLQVLQSSIQLRDKNLWETLLDMFG